MPCKPRIELVGTYHIINRGVAQNTIMLDAIEQGCSQQMIVKVLDILQPAVYGVIKE